MRKSCFFFLLFLLSGKFVPAQTVLPGLQAGYAFCKTSKLEAGLNLYYCGEDANDHFHVVGPSFSVTGFSSDHVFYVGHQWGLNYHFFPMKKHFFGYRINAAFENNRLGDQRIGADIGLSWFGIFGYVGYYYPTGHFENPNISRFRIGLRLIFNGAPVEEIVDF